MSTWIVIERFGGSENAAICIDEDGRNRLFDSQKEAQKFADEECQEGTVVEVGS